MSLHVKRVTVARF